MIELLSNLSPTVQALIGTLFTFGCTALGAAGVFLAKDINKRVLNGMLGFASGVMIAASYFSLLAPAVALSEDLDVPVWLPAVSGFLLGGFFCYWSINSCLTCIQVRKTLKGSKATGSAVCCW